MRNRAMTSYGEKAVQEKAAVRRMLAYQRKMETMVKDRPQRHMHRKG